MLKRRTLYIWIAMLAILFGAFAPFISHMLTAGYGGSAVTAEICSASGNKLLKVSDADGSKAPLSAKHCSADCAFCSVHGSTLALTNSQAHIFVIEIGRDFYPPLFYAAKRSLYAWSAAYPRAPPSLA